MPGSDAVRDLFNAKAPGWRRKYDADGPLARRIAEFDLRLARRLSPPARVLEIGCGTGNLAFHLSGRGYRVSACDIAEKMLEEARRAFPAAPIDWVHLAPDWEKLPFEDGTMDAVVASSVFEYVERIDQVLGECRRVLRPGGVLLFTVPNPESGVRKLEAVVQPVAQAAKVVPLPGQLRRVERYLQYLRLSRNRLSVAGWRETVQRAGMRPAEDGLVQIGPFGMLQQSPLLLLAFERPPPPKSVK